LENYGFHPTVGMNVLTEKTLLPFDRRVIGIYVMLEAMGKTIVFLESSLNDPRTLGGLCYLFEIKKWDNGLALGRLDTYCSLWSSVSKPI